MSEIEELSSRILSAMDRVAAGIDGAGQAGAAELEATKAALEAERQSNALLSDKVNALAETQAQTQAAMEAHAAETATRLGTLDTQFQQLRKAHEMMVSASDALRAANAEGVGNADLINQSMQAELKAVQAMRRAEVAEANEIISGLLPLLNSASAQPIQEPQ